MLAYCGDGDDHGIRAVERQPSGDTGHTAMHTRKQSTRGTRSRHVFSSRTLRHSRRSNAEGLPSGCQASSGIRRNSQNLHFFSQVLGLGLQVSWTQEDA